MQKLNQDSITKKIYVKEKLEELGINVNLENGQISYNEKDKLNIKCTALYLLRHGHTKGTQEHMFMSDISDNSHICQKGVQDILKLKNCYEKYKLDSVIICSDIPRVLETADIFKSVNPTLNYFYKKNFKGINNQGWENKNANMFTEQDLIDYEEREIRHNIFAKSSYGESWSQVLLNCIDLINYLNEEHLNKRILLIGQGSIIRGIDILIGKFERPWDNYDVKKLYNFEEKNSEDNYGTISCILEKTKGEFDNTMNTITGNGMIHGRFQPFTIGHMQHLKRALNRVPKGNKLYIGITKPFISDNGISEGDDHRDNKNSNPYTFEQRREMVLASIKTDPDISDRLNDIIVIPWSMNNMEDLDKIINFFMPDKNVTQFMNIIPNDGWEYEKEKLLHNKGFTTINLVDPSKPRITSATEVRKRYKCKSHNWTDIAPKGTQHILTELEKNPEIIPQQYTSIDDFLSKCESLTPLSIAKNVLARTPEEQEKVDATSINLYELLQEEVDRRHD